jgi:hypothetical protein
MFYYILKYIVCYIYAYILSHSYDDFPMVIIAFNPLYAYGHIAYSY